MNLSKNIARNFIFPSILKIGGEKVFRIFSKHNILNLVYHGVVENDSNYFSPRHIQKDSFDKQMQYISRNFNVISLSEAFYLYKNNIYPKAKTITISFDDGYLNNLNVALPIIEKYKIKSTFFISGICAKDSNKPILWADIIATLKLNNKDVLIKVGDRSFVNHIDVNSGKHLSDLIKKMGVIERDILLNSICSEYNIKESLNIIPNEIWALMNKEDIKKLASSPFVEIGSHGYLHYNYNFIPLKDTLQDMIKSKNALENVLDKEINMIAYPDGGYNNEVIETANDIGFVNQLAVNYINKSDWENKIILNRHGVSASTNYESGIFYINKAFTNKAFN